MFTGSDVSTGDLDSGGGIEVSTGASDVCGGSDVAGAALSLPQETASRATHTPSAGM